MVAGFWLKSRTTPRLPICCTTSSTDRAASAITCQHACEQHAQASATLRTMPTSAADIANQLSRGVPLWVNSNSCRFQYPTLYISSEISLLYYGAS